MPKLRLRLDQVQDASIRQAISGSAGYFGLSMDDPMEGGIFKIIVGLSESALEVSRQTCEAINVLMEQNKELMRKVERLETRMN